MMSGFSTWHYKGCKQELFDVIKTHITRQYMRSSVEAVRHTLLTILYALCNEETFTTKLTSQL